MKYDIRLADSGKFVVCKVFEAITTQFALEFGKATVEFCHQHGLNRQLYDVRQARNIDTVYHNYDFAHNEMAELGLIPANRAAILVDYTDRTHDFVQIASRNAGYNVKVFVDESQAVAWLEQSDL